MRTGRGGNSSGWQCALLAALLAPTLACFSEDGTDLGEASSAKGSQPVAAVKQVSTQPTLKISLPASGSQHQALKRSDEQLDSQASHWLPSADVDWSELARNSLFPNQGTGYGLVKRTRLIKAFAQGYSNSVVDQGPAMGNVKLID